MVEQEPVPEDGRTWRVVRLDDNGNRFEVARCATRDEAQRLTDQLAAGGHKQTYWVEGCAARCKVTGKET
jgi:hypothetical protein